MRRVDSGRVEIYDVLGVPQLRHCVPPADFVMRAVRTRYKAIIWGYRQQTVVGDGKASVSRVVVRM